MSEKRKIQRFNLDEGRIWEAIEGLSPYKTTYTLEEVCEKLNEQQSTIEHLKGDKAIAEDYANIFEKENVKLRKQIDEQQEQISELERKLKKYSKIGEEQLKQIIDLQDELKEKEEDEQLYANEIVKLNKEAKEVLDFKSLGGDY